MAVIDWSKFKKKNRPKIRMLSTCFGWGSGAVFHVKLEDDDYIYFDDENNRWTGIKKNQEGKGFEYIKDESIIR